MRIRLGAAAAAAMLVMCTAACLPEGGDGDPTTGECEIDFEEPTQDAKGEWVNGTAIFTCNRKPSAHKATVTLEFHDGDVWRAQGHPVASATVPNPRLTLAVQAACRLGWWHVRASVDGYGPDGRGGHTGFHPRATSWNRYLRCKKGR